MTNDSTPAPEGVTPEQVASFNLRHGSMQASSRGHWVRFKDYAALAADRDAQKARADAAEAELVGAFEAAAEAVEELSKSPSSTTWGQVKGHIRAMGDVGDRRAYQQMRSALAAQTARAEVAEVKVAKLVEAMNKIKALDDNAECCGQGECGGYSPPECCGQPLYGLDRAQNIARAAIAEVQTNRTTTPTKYERKVAQMKEDFPNGI